MKQRKTINKSFAIMCVLVILITNVICTSAVTQEQLPPRKETKEVETDVDKKTTKDVVEEPVETIEEEIVEEVVEEVIPYTDYSVPSYGGFKSYSKHTKKDGRIRYKESSLQYKLQMMAYTGDYGFRQVDGRFCVALGSHFTTSIGQYFDLILENGTVIPCVLGDAKADVHTDSSNIFTVHNNCCSEFIIDKNVADPMVLEMGNCSWCCDEWKSPVKTIRLYEKNVFAN